MFGTIGNIRESRRAYPVKRPKRVLCRCLDCGLVFEANGPIEFCGGCGYIRLMERLTDEQRAAWHLPPKAA